MRSGIFKFALLILLAVYCGSYFYTGWHFIDTIDLSIHEIGHIVFAPFGKFVGILGGSLFQLLLPLLAFGYFSSRGQPFSAAAVLMWLSVNFFYVGVYAGDAIDMNLPLVAIGGGDGGEIEHDWTYLLSQLGILQHTAIVARVFYFLGFLSIGLGLVVGRFAYARDRDSVYPLE
jgi:hypothetical protein